MLVAQNKEKKLIMLHSRIPRKTLLNMKKSNMFYCPQCKEEVILKVGNVKIPHFAHLKNNSCDQSFSENESLDHLLGKEQLYQFFIEKGIDTQLEPFLKSIRQRPDLFVTTKNKDYAIEFQCSPINKEMFISRNKGYQSLGIIPIWIPLTPQKILGQKKIVKLSIPIGFRKFMLHHQNHSFFITYHPHTKQFIYISNLLHVYGNTFLTKITPLLKEFQHFPFCFPKRISPNEFTGYIKTYNILKAKFLKMRIFLSRRGVNDLFLRSIYELKLSINNLPLFLGIPIKGNEQLKLFSVEWQTEFLYFMKLTNISSFEMSGQTIWDYLQWANLPITKSAVDVVKTYCRILQQLNVQEVSSTVSEERLDMLIYQQFVAFNH